MSSPANQSLDDAKKRILARVSLEQLILESVSLQKRGSRLTGLCPFHAEKSPSFYVFDDHYHCFGCHAHGDAISFIRRTRELSFIESLRYLAGKFNIEAPELEENIKYQQRRQEITSLGQIMVRAMEFFVEELHSPRGADARSYLLKRGFSEENIKKFNFGLTPPEHFGLVRHLRSFHYRPEDLIKVGLASTSTKTGNIYDFFRDRIMIPIRDHSGKVVAFGGRTLINDQAKYKNSAATSLFDKGHTLFGLSQAKDSIKEHGQAILVEGYMDTLCLWQEGFTSTVASMGTALSARQLKLLSSQAKCREVVLLFDGDKAGLNATFESIDVAMSVPELHVRAAVLSDGHDPDTFVRTNGKEALSQLITQSRDLIEVVIDHLLDGATPATVMKIVTDKFVPWVASLQDPIKKSYFLNVIASRTGISSDVLLRQVRTFHFAGSIPAKATRQKVEVAPTTAEVDVLPTRQLTPIERGVLGHLYFAQPHEVDLAEVRRFIVNELSLEPLWEQFAFCLLESLSESKTPTEIKSQIASEFTQGELMVLQQIFSTAPELFQTTDRRASLRSILLEQRKVSLQTAVSTMKQQIQIIGSRDPEGVSEILQQIMTLTKTLSSLKAPAS
jgi:DNA primase